MIEYKIKELLKTKPEVLDIIGYGSGVVKQNGYKITDKKQIDLIVTVDSNKDYHNSNYNSHKEEYSKLGYNLLPIIKNLGTDINYISNIEHNGDTFKMGIIEREDLIDDLINWKNFFMAGRCQKPINVIKTNDELDKAVMINRLNALKVALILNHDKQITKKELFESICSLSYIGDIRMLFKCENPNKVRNIVDASMGEYDSMYSNDELYFIMNGKVKMNTKKIITDLSSMPKSMIKDTNDVTKEDLVKLKKLFYQKIHNMNMISSTAQPAKSILLNGTSKSINYLNEKIKKGQM